MPPRKIGPVEVVDMPNVKFLAFEIKGVKGMNFISNRGIPVKYFL